MRKLFFFFGLFIASQLSAQSRFIHRSAQQLIDSTGQVVQLNGVNLGGWLLWEAWIWGKGFVKETTVYNKLQNVAGSAAAAEFRKGIHDNFITETDIGNISANCFNVVRVPFNHTLLEDDDQPFIYKPEGWAVLDRLLGWCEKHKVYVVLDLHSAPGGNSGFFIADPDKKKLWEDPKNVQRTAALWKAVAQRYKDRTIIAGYDLLNEPGFPDGKKLMSVYAEIIAAIRSADKNHLLFLEGNKLATDFSMFEKLPDENCALSYHLYTFFTKKEKKVRKKMAKQVAFAQRLNAPLWCGEWGQNDNATVKMTQRVMSETANGLDGLCIWTWKVAILSDKQPYMNRIPTSESWENLIRWIADKGPQPTKAEAQQAMKEFVEAVKAEKMIPNKDLLTILRACK